VDGALIATRTRAAEPWIAAALIGTLGAGAVFALGGLVIDEIVLASAGGALLGIAIIVLVAAGWANGLEIVALSLPLPALYGTTELRVATALPITAAVLVGWMLHHGVSARAPDLRVLPLRSLAFLLFALLLTTATAQGPLTSARELANLLVLFAFLALAADRIRARHQDLRCAVTFMVAVGAVCGILGVLETLAVIPGEFPRTGTRFYRAALGFGQPNALGLFLAMCVPLAAHEAGRTRGAARAAAIAALVLITLGLIGTFSRGSWLSLLAGTGALLLVRSGRYALRVWLVAVVAAVLADIISGGALRDTVARTIDDWVIEQRIGLMLSGVLMFLDYPLAGVGPGGYADHVLQYGAWIPGFEDFLPTPHNAFIQMAAESGIIGLLAFCAFLVAALRAAVRGARRVASGPDREEASLQRALLWSLAVAVLACMVLWPFSHGTGQAVMFVMAAGFAAGRR
jgi:O-antigen ligase